jgi:uncharacterized protein YndB with AHSA1/START domain
VSKIEPVRKSVVVNVPREHAFRVFTEGLDRWWPRQHHIGKSPLARAILEPREGGRWYSVCEDGSECDVGKVLKWDPPNGLVLAWQITAAWAYDPAFVTEVEVKLIAEGAEKTRVELEHRDLERYGDAALALRKSIDADDGWGIILRSFADVASR